MPGEMADVEKDNECEQEQNGILDNHEKVYENDEYDSKHGVGDNSKDPAPSANTKMKKDRDKLVQSRIEEAKNGAIILELNDLSLSEIPEELLELTHLQVLLLVFTFIVTSLSYKRSFCLC